MLFMLGHTEDAETITNIYARFSSLETSAIELKLQQNVQNGLNSRSVTVSVI